MPSDWDKGLPFDVLATIGRSSERMHIILTVSRTWRECFEETVTSIRIPYGTKFEAADIPILQRFQNVTNLNLGEVHMDARPALRLLAPLRWLRSLTLGAVPTEFSRGKPIHKWPLAWRVTGHELEALKGMPLRRLDLGFCHR